MKKVKASGQEFFGNATYNTCTNQGLAEHGFILGLYCLLRAEDIPVDQLYDFSMRQVVKLQGDTDTNAAIVGGLIGAYVGLDNIDVAKVRKVLECKPVQTEDSPLSHVRPKFVCPGHGCIDEMLELIRIAPRSFSKVTQYVDQGLTIE